MINRYTNSNNEQENINFWLEVKYPQRLWVVIVENTHLGNQSPRDDLSVS
jgi:hypothetical protein